MSDIDAKQDELTLHDVRVGVSAFRTWRDRILMAWAALRGLPFQFNAKTIHIRNSGLIDPVAYYESQLTSASEGASDG